MLLSREEVERVAGLARLTLTEEEKERYREQLSAILEYAQKLNALDVSNIPPTAQVLPLQNVMRPDEPAPSLSQDEVLANAPSVEAGCFRVQAILEEE